MKSACQLAWGIFFFFLFFALSQEKHLVFIQSNLRNYCETVHYLVFLVTAAQTWSHSFFIKDKDGKQYDDIDRSVWFVV